LRRKFRKPGDPKGHLQQYSTKHHEILIDEKKRRLENGEPPMTPKEEEQFLIDLTTPPKPMIVDEGFKLRVPNPRGLVEPLSDIRDRGARKFETMSEEQKARINELAMWFRRWDNAYDGSKRVWEIMKNDDEFDIDVLISQIQLSFADFLVSAILEFREEEENQTFMGQLVL
jgi:hypothetical protein